MLDHKFKTCIINGQEQYYLNDQLVETRTELFPEGLLSFIDLDMDKIAPLFSELNTNLKLLANTQEDQYADEALHILDTIAERHVYFEIFRLEWTDRIRQAQAVDSLQKLLRQHSVRSVSKNLAALQRQIKELFACVLDFDGENGSASEKMASYYMDKGESAFQFQPQSTTFELWDNAVFAEVLYPESICDLISYHLCECVKRELRLRICKNCGRYFHMSGRSTAMYCHRVYDEKGRTCKGIGSILAWSKRTRKNEVFLSYRKEYKKRFARINAGKIARNDFYAWSKLAKEKKAECEAGEISYEDFTTWLRTS